MVTSIAWFGKDVAVVGFGNGVIADIEVGTIETRQVRYFLPSRTSSIHPAMFQLPVDQVLAEGHFANRITVDNS